MIFFFYMFGLQKLYEEATQVGSSAVGNIRTVASFCAEEKVMELHSQKCAVPVRLGMEHGLVSGAGFGMAVFFLYSVFAATYYAGARLVHAGDISFGEVFRVRLTISFVLLEIIYVYYSKETWTFFVAGVHGPKHDRGCNIPVGNPGSRLWQSQSRCCFHF